MYLSVSGLFRYCIIICALSIASCKSSRVYKTSVTTANGYHSRYDDTTLTVDNSSILMPYNRFIDPAGTVIRFGNPTLENHSLDCALLSGQNILAVEDRYGLAFLDVQNNKLLFHLDYAGTYKGLMSTYSGIKILEYEKFIHIFWGASLPDEKKNSFIMDAVWDGKKATINSSIPFVGIAPSPMALPNDIAINKEDGENYLYVLLNGNNQLTKKEGRGKIIFIFVNYSLGTHNLSHIISV